MNVPVHPPMSQLNQKRRYICGLYAATILKKYKPANGLLIQERQKNTNECTAVEIKTLTRE